MERRLLGLVTVGNETSQQMDQEVEGTAMACMVDLTDVLELVIDALDESALPQQQLIGVDQQAFTHIRAHFGDEVNAVFDQEMLSQWLGDARPDRQRACRRVVAPAEAQGGDHPHCQGSDKPPATPHGH